MCLGLSCLGSRRNGFWEKLAGNLSAYEVMVLHQIGNRDDMKRRKGNGKKLPQERLTVNREFQKDMELELSIEDMGEGGEGIGKKDGIIFFVKDAVIGDRVLAKIMKMKKSYGYARLLQVLEPSPFRAEPRCSLYRQCGGCQLQALAYQKQLEFKENRVKNNLKRIGGFRLPEDIQQQGFGRASFDIPAIHPIVGIEEPYHYRNKAQFPIGTDKDGKIVAGFYAAHTHTIIPNRNCLLGVDANEKILDALISYMEEYQVPAYQEETGTGLVRHALIRCGFATGELMACLVINGKSLPFSDKLVEKLQKIKGITSIVLNVNEKNTNVILGEEIIPLWGKPYITDFIGGIKYQISPLSFYQVNPVQTQKLYKMALEFAGLSGTETVWDLYCGIGTISLFLAQKAKQVYGVEIVAPAIADARENARINGIANVEFFVGKAEDVLPEFYERGSAGSRDAEGMLHPDVIVVDPPRKGCDKKCLETIVKMEPERVVYVSCDSATLARDLKYLCGGGYEVREVGMVDMFGQSVHVETVCLLSKLHADQHIEVELHMDELDLTAAESKATYEEIKDYVLENMGLKVSSLYIAQVKEKCGIIERVNYNQSKSENSRQPKCPPEKEAAIREALEHFRMI